MDLVGSKIFGFIELLYDFDVKAFLYNSTIPSECTGSPFVDKDDDHKN